MNREKECKTILENDKDTVIVGPAYNSKNKIDNKLRIYANGGLIGKIYVGDNKNGKSKLISEAYIEYSNNKETLKNFLDTKEKKEEDLIKILTDKKYIRLCKDALEERWTNKSKNNESDEEKLKKERYVETKILRKFMYSNENWNVIDMEVCFPTEFCKDAKFSQKTTKKPRFDMITISKDGIGIIELKVNNKSCENMNSHYEHMKYVQKNPGKFRKGILERIPYLIQNKLLNNKDFAKYEKELESKIWFGFLFVGGKKERSIEIVKNKLGNKKDLNGIKFMYCNDTNIDLLDINKMVSYEEFIKI